MPNKSFSYREVLGFGWSVMKANFWFFVGVWVVSFLISLLGQILGQIIERHPKAIAPFWFFAFFAVTFIIQTILGIGLIKITLSFCDGLKPSFGTLFNGLDCFWRYIGAGLLYALIIGGASIACVLLFILLSTVTHSPYFILPVLIAFLILVVILSIKFCLCCYFVIDKGLGPINALKASSMATAGAIDSLAVFSILCCLINMLGVLCFFVGLFATIPTVIVAMALVYRQLSEQTPELAELGIGTPSTRGAGDSTHPFAGMQPNPIIPSIQSIQSGPSIRPGAGVQPTQSVQRGDGMRADSAKAALAATAGPAPDIQREKENNKSFFFWLGVLVILGAALAAGVTYRLWPRSIGKATVSSKDITFSPKDIAVSSKDVAVSSNDVVVSSKKTELKGILYSEDNPSALVNGKIVKEGSVIDGIKVVKIHKDSVEFEKNGEKWTQRLK